MPPIGRRPGSTPVAPPAAPPVEAPVAAEVEAAAPVATTPAAPVLRPAQPPAGSPVLQPAAPPVTLPNAPMGEVNDTSTVAATIPASLTAYFKGPEALSLDKIKQAFGGSQPHPHLTDVAGWFKGNLELSAGALLPAAPQLAPLKAALGGMKVIEVPYNEIQLSKGVYGTRFIPYDGASHKEIIAVVHDPAFKNGMITKDMVHMEQGNPSGSPKEFFSGDRGSQGFSHGGAILPVIKPGGEKDVAWVDWPTGYGRLNGVSYGGQALLGFMGTSTEQKDYSKPLPANFSDIVAKQSDVMRTATALAMVTTPFASGAAQPEFTNYHFNPLTVKQGSDVAGYADLIARPNDPEALKKLKSEALYCREGVHTLSNIGEAPWNQKSVDEGRLSQKSFDNLKAMKAAFDAAGGSEVGQASKGWAALKAKGFINEQQLDALVEQNMNHVPFVLSPDDAAPISSYGPKYLGKTPGLGNNINVKPMTIAGLLRGMMHINFPREKIAKALSEQLTEALAAPGANQEALLGGAAGVANAAPTDPKLVAKFGNVMAAKFQAGILADEGTRKVVRDTIQYERMDADSKARVDAYIGNGSTIAGKYVEAVGDTSLSYGEFMSKMGALEKEVDSLKIVYPGFTNRSPGDLMSFVPPSRAFLSQHETDPNTHMNYKALGYAVPNEYLK